MELKPPDLAGGQLHEAPDRPPVSRSEQTPSAQIGRFLFRHRGWVPVPFLIVPLLAHDRPTAAQWIGGIILMIVGESFRLAGVAAAGHKTRRRSRNVEELVTYGIFAWTRNPLYVGNFFLWIGIVVVSGVFWFLPVAVLLFAAEYSLIVRFEEGVLESIFGREYLEYRHCTPRWVPSPPKKPAKGSMDWRGAVQSETSTFLAYLVLLTAFAVKDYFELF
jgi:protein-S-isoprenylcysteine O-methyltransferase Ste14